MDTAFCHPHMTAKACGIILFLFAVLTNINPLLGQIQSRKEYIYLNGRILAIEDNTPVRSHRIANDYDGDSKSDLSVFRAGSNQWWISYSGGGYTGIQWGSANDDLVPADYDGDGKTDIAIRNHSTNTWYIIPSSAPATYTTYVWGATTDIPVPGYYDGDNKADIAVWRPSNGTWYIQLSSTPGGNTTIQWGQSGDRPVPSDYDGDGITDIAVWRQSNSTWYILLSGSPGNYVATQWGLSPDIPVTGDYDGDSKTDIAVRRPSTGAFYILLSGSPGSWISPQWGNPTDSPITGEPMYPDFAMTIDAFAKTLPSPGGSIAYTVTPLRTNGVASAVSLSSIGLPTGVSFSCSPNPVSVGQSSLCTINTPAYISPNTYSFTFSLSNSHTSHTIAASFTLHPQPTSMSIDPTMVFPGVGSHLITVGNAANMTIYVKYQFTPWGAEDYYEYEAWLGTMNSSSQMERSLPQNVTPGKSKITHIRNELREDWHELSSQSQPELTVRPPKPTLFSSSPSELQLPAEEGTQTVTIENEQNQKTYIWFTYPNESQGGVGGLVMDGQGIWHNGYLACSYAGEYIYMRVRNDLDEVGDNDTDDPAWLILSDKSITLLPCNP